MTKILRSFGTHDGTFHADEVTACALLLLYNQIDENLIQRTREPELLAKCEYVCDVGGLYDPEQKIFDHHQVGYGGQLSSAGMILEYMKHQGIVSTAEFNLFQQSIIAGVDAHDNGLDPSPHGVCTYSHIITNFMPVVHDASQEEQEIAFRQALHFAYGHLERMQKRFRYIQSCRDTVQIAMQQYQECLIFDQPLPWLDSFFELDGENHQAQFVIMPAGPHWKLRGIPPKLSQRMKVREPLPASWAGLLGDDLKKITGITGAIFCHKGRFISVWATKEDALQALNLVLNKERK